MIGSISRAEGDGGGRAYQCLGGPGGTMEEITVQKWRARGLGVLLLTGLALND